MTGSRDWAKEPAQPQGEAQRLIPGHDVTMEAVVALLADVKASFASRCQQLERRFEEYAENASARATLLEGEVRILAARLETLSAAQSQQRSAPLKTASPPPRRPQVSFDLPTASQEPLSFMASASAPWAAVGTADLRGCRELHKDDPDTAKASPTATSWGQRGTSPPRTGSPSRLSSEGSKHVPHTAATRSRPGSAACAVAPPQSRESLESSPKWSRNGACPGHRHDFETFGQQDPRVLIDQLATKCRGTRELLQRAQETINRSGVVDAHSGTHVPWLMEGQLR